MGKANKIDERAVKYSRVGVIYTDGAYCAPLRRPNPETGKLEWVWIVVNFDPFSHECMDGRDIIAEYCADTRDELVSEVFGPEPEERFLSRHGYGCIGFYCHPQKIYNA